MYEEFITSDDYIGKYCFTIITEKDPTVIDIYEGLLEMFNDLSTKISNIKERYVGEKEFVEVPLSRYVVDTIRRKSILGNDLEGKQGEGVSQNASYIDSKYKIDLSVEDWFVYQDNFGTTEEKRFVAFFATKIKKLKEKYNEIYLIRNERNFHIYSFKDGNRFEPDYVLILINKGLIIEQQQIFIEPKGTHLLEKDSWKEEFLMEIEKNASCVCYHDKGDKYKIFGLPFFNHEKKQQEFEKEFDKITKIDREC